MLKNENSSRVTYAAVFIPKDKTKPVQYVLPEGIRLASGFSRYDPDTQHKSKKLGTLCCGNCYAEGHQVEIHHRKPTPERIAGEKMKGRPGTFCAYPNTIEEHTQYCQNRRITEEEAELLKHGVTFNINMKATYSYRTEFKRAARGGHHIEHDDPRLDGRVPVAINEDLAEIIKKSARFSRKVIQDSMFVVGGKVLSFGEAFIDGDGWQDLLRETIKQKLKKHFVQPHRIFHVVNPHSLQLVAFNEMAEAKKGKIKIPLQQYQFKDRNGRWNIIQPSIEAATDDVKKLFERMGDYLVMGKFRYIPKKPENENSAYIHQIRILLDSPEMAVELYNTPKRKIRDLEAMELLHRDFDKIAILDPKIGPKPKAKSALKSLISAGQMELFAPVSP